MVSRKQWFLDLRELIDSAESNLDHGRSIIGAKKLGRVWSMIGNAKLNVTVPTILAREG